MTFREWLKPRMQDLLMRQMNPLRGKTTELATGNVLEIGFGTALNLEFYGPDVKSVTGVDPMDVSEVEAVRERIERSPFPVEHRALRADGTLPFDAGRFDSVVTTFTLCSIPEVERALHEMARVLRPGGQYVFLEHGLAPVPSTAKWQERIDPLWTRLFDGCHINRRIDRLVERGGFELERVEQFRARGPGIAAHMYSGVARHAG